jgi:hypothetical protein
MKKIALRDYFNIPQQEQAELGAVLICLSECALAKSLISFIGV